jgi:hypothetical protein
MASTAPMAGHNHGVAIPYQRGQEHQNGPHGSSAPPKANQDQGKSSAYAALWELMRKTDASVVRQVVRENWQKCLTGSDYHSTFIVSYFAGTVFSPLRQITPRLGLSVLKFLVSNVLIDVIR